MTLDHSSMTLPRKEDDYNHSLIIQLFWNFLWTWSAAFFKGCEFPFKPNDLLITSDSILSLSDWVACISRGNIWLMHGSGYYYNSLLGNWIITEWICPSFRTTYSLIRANLHVLPAWFYSLPIQFPLFLVASKVVTITPYAKVVYFCWVWSLIV